MIAPMLLVHPKLYSMIVDAIVPLDGAAKLWKGIPNVAVQIVQDPYCALTSQVLCRSSNYRSSKFYKARRYRREERYVAYWMDVVSLARKTVVL